MERKKINTIFWDLGAVLFSEVQISGEEFDPVRRLFGISKERSDQIFDSLWPEGIRLGKITEEEYWQEYIRMSSKKPPLTEVKRLYRGCIRANEELLGLVIRFSETYQQLILSNQAREWMDFIIHKWGLLRYFEKVFCSGEMGIHKPQQEFYKVAIVDSGADPKGILYIDDSQKNIEAAEEFGIVGLVFTGSKDLIRNLTSLGIV